MRRKTQSLLKELKPEEWVLVAEDLNTATLKYLPKDNKAGYKLIRAQHTTEVWCESKVGNIWGVMLAD